MINVSMSFSGFLKQAGIWGHAAFHGCVVQVLSKTCKNFGRALSVFVSQVGETKVFIWHLSPPEPFWVFWIQTMAEYWRRGSILTLESSIL